MVARIAQLTALLVSAVRGGDPATIVKAQTDLAGAIQTAAAMVDQLNAAGIDTGGQAKEVLANASKAMENQILLVKNQVSELKVQTDDDRKKREALLKSWVLRLRR